MNNDLISREALKKAVEDLVAGGAERLKDYYENGSKKEENEWIGGIYDAWELICDAPTVEYPFYQEAYQTGYEEAKKELESPIVQGSMKDLTAEEIQHFFDVWKNVPLQVIEDRPQGEWNTHQVACILAELFGDTCACNYCGIDEWLPKACDFANKECPDVVGVACWEQFLKHGAKMKGGAE